MYRAADRRVLCCRGVVSLNEAEVLRLNYKLSAAGHVTWILSWAGLMVNLSQLQMGSRNKCQRIWMERAVRRGGALRHCVD